MVIRLTLLILIKRWPKFIKERERGKMVTHKFDVPHLVERSDSPTGGEHITHVLAREGHLIGQLEQTTKLHPSLDTLNSVRTEVDKRLCLNFQEYTPLVNFNTSIQYTRLQAPLTKVKVQMVYKPQTPVD